jgi:hypothetical protein
VPKPPFHWEREIGFTAQRGFPTFQLNNARQSSSLMRSQNLAWEMTALIAF